MKCCDEYAQSPDPSSCGDLWIQALTYFRDLESPDCEICLERALSIISGEKEKAKDSKKDEILSPLLVLEIL